ncbi:MAG: sigma 54-interacting transcriptional regulator [Desulfobacteraceae bacterium]|nr:sigma 54-interacting transcriptional regulator [Desulfobacteraceae bacterium]
MKRLCSYCHENSEQPTHCELEDILESSHDGLFITDGSGNILVVNSAWERICGIHRDFVIGKNAQDLVNQKFYTESSVMAAIKSRKKTTIWLQMTRGEKVGQKILATAIPIWDPNGEIKRVVANIRDITEILYLKELLEKTQQLNQIYAAELEQMRLQQINKNIDIIARSPETRRVLEMASQVAKVDSTVLLTGESGSGKEVFANAIHRLGHRAEGPLIKINCGAIPESLLESELFGYDAGAFTGARKQGKPGMFEMAKKGTLFLDEIGDISFNLQAKLLRALQDHQIVRVGGLKPIPIDTRIIAATNKNLKEMVKNLSFREDLYYRLNVVSIEIPPLRERKEDIPLLVLHFVDKINKKYLFTKRIATEVIDNFILYSWPGNIRELENIIERMLVMTEEEQIQPIHLPAYLRNQVYPVDNVPNFENIPFKRAMERTERQILEQALQRHGSTRKVAKALKVNQSTVVRKIKKYGLSSLCQDLDEPATPYEDLKFRL